MGLKLTSKQLQGLQRAILSAYPNRASLEQALFFEMSVNLNEVTGVGTLADTTFAVIQWARSRGEIEQLIAALKDANPGNPDLKAFIAEIGVRSAAPPALDGPIAGQLQSIVVESGVVDGVGPSGSEWIRQYQLREAAICQIETSVDAKGWGTGFLVAADVVMTNQHVTSKVVEMGSAPQARFDFAELGTGTVVKAVADWDLVSSPPEDLDYALLRLAGHAGDHVLGNASRGFIDTKVGATFTKDEPIFILQHPNRQPLKVGAGYLRDVNSWVNRIAYTTNTEPGSSGSPCFNLAWQLVALHHHGEDFTNHGTTMEAIVADLKAQGKDGLLG